MITADEIVNKLNERRAQMGDELSRMIQIRDVYHGDVITPLPELERDEMPSVANLLNQGLEQLSMRIASVTPNVTCPPRDPNKKSELTASRKRRNAIFGWWDNTGLDIKLAQRARHLLGYAHTYSWVKWDVEQQVPVWRIADPLCTFLPLDYVEDHINNAPADAICVHVKNVRFMRQKYPHINWDAICRDDETLIEIAEYADADEYVMVAIGSRRITNNPDGWRSTAFTFGGDSFGGLKSILIERTPNRAGMVPIGTATRVGLNRPMSKFEGMLGMYTTQARLQALEIIAVERGIFPEMWAVSRPGETVRVVTAADGLKGIIGEIQGGQIQEINTNPGFMTNPAVDRLERNQRTSVGIPAEFGGESASNIRTGRRGDAVLSNTVDFPIQEAQRLLQRSLQYENKVAIALAKGYAGNQKKSFYVNWKGATGWTDYVPNDDFTTDDNIVSYSHPGADLNDLVVGGGQRLGMKTISRRRFMDLDPLIDDPEREHDTVMKESLEDALLSGIQAQAANGAIPPADVARIISLVGSDKLELAEAIEKVHQEAQKRQATPAPQGSPETQPGLAMPGAGAEQPSIPPPGNGAAATQPPGGIQSLRSMMGQLQKPPDRAMVG